jgi:hypothetical protein
MGSWVLASLAVTLSFGFSTAAVFWVAGLLGDPVAPATVIDQPAQGSGTGAPIEVAPAYWTAASVWGGLVVLSGVCFLPLAAWVLRRRPLSVSALVALAVGMAVLAATLADDGEDIVSAGAEWFLIGGLALGGAILLVVLPHGGEDFVTLVGHDYEPMRAEAVAESKVVRRWRVAMARYRYHHAIGLMAALGGLATIAWALLRSWEPLFGDPDPLPDSWNAPLNGLTTVGVTAVTAIAVWLVTLGVASWRSPKMRMTVGILWDLVSFWPRVAHPLCPLPYGGRAVRAVAARANQLANEELSEDDEGNPVRPYETVVISGHSQGALIAQAACAVLYEAAHREPPDEWLSKCEAAKAMKKTCLVTYGSQLQFIYARLFPSYFGFALQREMFTAMLETRWRSMYRWTDPLGGPVLSWPYIDGRVRAEFRFGPSVQCWTTMSCDLHCKGHKPVGVDEPEFRGLTYRRWSVGPDIRLRDPGLVADSAFAARLPARGHSGYEGDPGFDVVVATLAAQPTRLPPDCPHTTTPSDPRGT